MECREPHGQLISDDGVLRGICRNFLLQAAEPAPWACTGGDVHVAGSHEERRGFHSYGSHEESHGRFSGGRHRDRLGRAPPQRIGLQTRIAEGDGNCFVAFSLIFLRSPHTGMMCATLCCRLGCGEPVEHNGIRLSRTLCEYLVCHSVVGRNFLVPRIRPALLHPVMGVPHCSIAKGPFSRGVLKLVFWL